ncbi:transcriptional regulator, LysR family [Rhizobiales bacterium GAS113]|nr:transcriptional regulator, LysR family [Rhizobiales bacterium GAS113]
MRKLPSLNALRAFEAAARHESVTQAAEELGVSHSAVSQQVRSLEEHLGQMLFHRNGRRVEPTETARVLLEEVRSAFDRIAIAVGQFSARSGNATITVNATPSFAMRWLIPRSSAFQLENPTVSVVVETSASDAIDHLTKSYDFIFRRAPMHKTDHSCIKLLDDHSTAVMSPQLVSTMRCEAPDDLKQGVLLHLKSRPDAWRLWFEASGISTIDSPPGPYYEHFFLSLQAAISGLGIAVGPLCFVEDDLASNRLVAPFPEQILAGPGFHVLYPSIAMRSRHHRAFLDALLLAARTGSPSSI